MTPDRDLLSRTQLGVCSAAGFATSLWEAPPHLHPLPPYLSQSYLHLLVLSLLLCCSSSVWWTGCAELSVPGWPAKQPALVRGEVRANGQGVVLGAVWIPTRGQHTPSTDWASSWLAWGPMWPPAEGTHGTKHKFPLTYRRGRTICACTPRHRHTHTHTQLIQLFFSEHSDLHHYLKRAHTVCYTGLNQIFCIFFKVTRSFKMMEPFSAASRQEACCGFMMGWLSLSQIIQSLAHFIVLRVC